MKFILLYYSYSGNTTKVAEVLRDCIKQDGSVEVIRLEAIDESGAFFTQAVRALKRAKAKLKAVKTDLSEYDVICLGTPIWALAPAPAINKYLDECTGIQGKDIILFVTYGSGFGIKRCLDIMEKEVKAKGAKKIFRFSIQESKVDNKNLVNEVIKSALKNEN